MTCPFDEHDCLDARAEVRALRARVADLEATCCGLGCGHCEVCVQMQTARANRAERLADAVIADRENIYNESVRVRTLFQRDLEDAIARAERAEERAAVYRDEREGSRNDVIALHVLTGELGERIQQLETSSPGHISSRALSLWTMTR
jgi:hypothetical protein